MSTKVLLQHSTKYVYGNAVYLSPHLVRLRPAAHSRTPIEAYSFIVSPATHVIHWQQDVFGNFVARIDFTGPVQELGIEVKLIAAITPINPFDFFLDDYAQYFPFQYEESLKKDLSVYLEIVDNGPMIQQLIQKIDRSKSGMMDFLIMLNRLVHNEIKYTTRFQPGVQTSEESLEKALGSCRDSAWLLVQILRHTGLAARFVSGYLIQLNADPVPGSPVGADGAMQTDIADLHAWAEVFIPGAGWIGLDPTGGLLAAEGHIPLACTPSPIAAAPISGKSGVSDTTFTYSNSVTRF